jgi:ATP-binding cassette, subfamily C, bacterial
MRLLLIFSRQYPWRTAVMLLCLLLAGIAEGVGLSSLLPLVGLAAGRGTEGAAPSSPSAAEKVVDSVFRSVGLEPRIELLLAVIVAGMVLKGLLLLAANKQVGYAVARLATDLRLGLLRALLRTRWEYYIHQPIGAVANAIAAEARRASDAYRHAATILSLLVQTAVYAGVGFLVSWQAMLVALVAGAVLLYVFNRLVTMARRAGAKQTRLAKSLLSRLTDTLQGVKSLKAMARETLVGPLLEKETQKLNRALEREILSKEAMNTLQEPLIVTFVAAGLYFTLTRWGMPLSTVIVLAMLCAQMLGGLSKVQKEQQRMVTCESAYWAVREMIDEAEGALEVRRGTATPTLNRGVSLENVSFRYEERDILRSASAVIPSGELTVLVGSSGAGKTTVADMVIGLIEPQEGDVLVDGVALCQLDVRRWRSMIGYVPQETFLWHENVRLNVTLGDPALSDEDVAVALRASGAWEFVIGLPEGLETIVGERGLRISGGQRQRIALARALVRKPRLLVLDEATSGLDPATEAEICATLQELRRSVTVVAIAHYGPLMEVADRVYRVQDGTIELVRSRTPDKAASAAV